MSSNEPVEVSVSFTSDAEGFGLTITGSGKDLKAVVAECQRLMQRMFPTETGPGPVEAAVRTAAGVAKDVIETAGAAATQVVTELRR